MLCNWLKSYINNKGKSWSSDLILKSVSAHCDMLLKFGWSIGLQCLPYLQETSVQAQDGLPMSRLPDLLC